MTAFCRFHVIQVLNPITMGVTVCVRTRNYTFMKLQDVLKLYT